MIEPRPDIAPYTPMARLRLGPSAKVVAIRERAVGAAIAAATPWQARAAMRTVSWVASPPAREAAAKRASEKRKTLRRPQRSPILPPSSRRPPKVRA